jgi:hypothetical protein
VKLLEVTCYSTVLFSCFLILLLMVLVPPILSFNSLEESWHSIIFHTLNKYLLSTSVCHPDIILDTTVNNSLLSWCLYSSKMAVILLNFFSHDCSWKWLLKCLKSAWVLGFYLLHPNHSREIWQTFHEYLRNHMDTIIHGALGLSWALEPSWSLQPKDLFKSCLEIYSYKNAV